MPIAKTISARALGACAAALSLLLAGDVQAQQPAAGACSYRGPLDDMYCDANRDMVADVPSDPARLRDPQTLVFAYTPVEDPALYANQFRPFTDHLTQCTGRRVVYFQVTSNAAQIEAMRSGRLHIGGFSTGPTAFAVNLAGAIPFAVKGNDQQFESYRVAVIVRSGQPLPAALGPQGTARRAHLGDVEFRQSRPARLLPGARPDAGYRLSRRLFVAAMTAR